MKPVELLAPAKDYVSAVAAVDYGADAVYIGGARFGARQAAGNSSEEIARVVEYAHRFGVRVHATLNTLLTDAELADAEAQARELIAAGVDALIVQDMALRRMNLPVELHASTQMFNHTPEGARFLSDAGFARVILERALSLEEIRAICTATPAEVECFVHGAICVGYSGRCFLSRSISARSGNRGACSQPCRQTWDLTDGRGRRYITGKHLLSVRDLNLSARSGNRGACSQPCRQTWDLTDGRGRRYITGKHLLSVRDLNLSARIADLLDAGVTSFKIEGRLKDTGYIKNVVAYYRRAVDEALAVRPHLLRASVGESLPDFTPDPSKSFTRGESTWFFDGRRAGVASFDTPKSVGEPLGYVGQVLRDGFRLDRFSYGTPAGKEGDSVRPADSLAAGDGICFVTPAGSFGTNVNAVEGGIVRPNRMEGIAVGAAVYRNFDLRFNKLLEHSRTRRVIPASATVELSREGVRLTCTDCDGVTACADRSLLLELAKNPDANAAAVRTQAARSGDTIFAVREVVVSGGEWFVPASVVAELRREALGRLLQARVARPMAHRILPENQAALYPSERMGADENVTNRLAEAFYRDHGVREIAAPLEYAPSTAGSCVMRSAYCLRRELGQCLKEHPTLRGDLYLEHGTFRYRLDFDCVRCEMALVDCRRTEK